MLIRSKVVQFFDCLLETGRLYSQISPFSKTQLRSVQARIRRNASKLVAPEAPSAINVVDRSHTKWLLQFDGGSRGNPGLGGSGSALFSVDSHNTPTADPSEVQTVQTEKWSMYHFMGEKEVTNNVAEYQGLIDGLTQAVAMELKDLTIQGDSQLIIRQVQGTYKTKHIGLIPLNLLATKLLSKIPTYTLEYIPRALNSRADELSNIAMDTKETKAVIILPDGSEQDVVWPPKIAIKEKKKRVVKRKAVNIVVENDAPLKE